MKSIQQEVILRGFMFYVYVLQSEQTSTFYVGFTENIEKRLSVHNSGDNVSTRAGRPWRIIYTEGYLSKQDALGREKFLKSGSGKTFLRKQLKHFLETQD